MSAFGSPELSRWTLHTANSTYAVSLGLDDSALVLDYFGPKTDVVPRWVQPSMPPIMSTFADYAPVEFAALGTRNIHASELIIEYADGVRGSRLRYQDHRFERNDQTTHLSVRFSEETGLELIQHWKTHSASDVVERWVVFRDTRASGEPIRITRAFSGAISMHAPHGARIDYLAGGYLREFIPQSVDLGLGTLRIGSRQGVTGHLFAPTMALRVLDARGNPDEGAGTLGVALAWSGSWAMQAESHPNGLLRVSAGLDDEGTTLELAPGREVESPHLLAVHVSGGPDDLSRAWHRHIRDFVARSVDSYHHPVVYNSWEATLMDVRADQQLHLADIAADLGTEVFVIDDGWFRRRVDGDSGLGDWTADPEAFPAGLPAFAEAIATRGMRFGLWIEPEMVSPKSDLFHEHPDWVYRENGLPQAAVRNQFVLDLGNPEVYEWLEGTLRRLLTDQQISFLKWDMTRPITAPGTSIGGSQFEWSLRHTSAYYRLLEMIRREFPHVTIEGCAGGGGRLDNAVLGLVDTIWASDATGPRDRLRVQDGFLRAYPASVMGSWVTAATGARDRTPVSLEFRFVVSMAGVLGLSVDLPRWSPDELSVAKRMIGLYKELRPVIHQGIVHRHSDPQHHGYALEYAGGDEHAGRIVVLAYDTARERTGPQRIDPQSIPPETRVRLASADPAKLYSLRGDDSVHSGATLRTTGLLIPWALAPDADVLVLDPIA